MREMVGHLQRLYEASGCATDADRDRLRVQEQGLALLTEYLVVAGLARAIRDEQVEPGVRFVVVEDDPPADHLARLRRAAKGSSAEVLNFTRFVDRLWDGPAAARAALEASEHAEDLRIESFLGERTEDNPNRRYVSQRIRPFRVEEGQGGEASALSVVESSWLSGGGGPFVVLAAAGVGKSELAVVLQWRSAYQYETVGARGGFGALPPVAIRVPLRELRSFSIEAVAGYLASRLKLDRLRSQSVVAALLQLGRVAIILDGLEELPVGVTERDAGLAEFARVAERGAKILLTARTGYYGSQGSETAVLRAFPDDSVWSLEHLDSVSVDRLLKIRGATTEEAARVFALLPNPLYGVPLFAIWAWRVTRRTNADSQPAPLQGLTRASILSQLVELFCRRDAHRVGVSADVQLDALQMIAMHSAMFGSVSAEEVAVSVGDAESPFVRGPHALLMRDDEGVYRCTLVADQALREARAGTHGRPNLVDEEFRASWSLLHGRLLAFGGMASAVAAVVVLMVATFLR